MFGVGLPELILIMAIALIVVGPEKLPELAKTLARQMLELKRAANTLKDSLQEEEQAGIKPDEAWPRAVALTAQSPQALPGDQWVHEQAQGSTGLKALEHRAVEMSEPTLPSP